MGYLLVFLKEQIIALTKADHNKRDVEQLLSWFAKKLTNLAVLSIWNSISLDYIVAPINSDHDTILCEIRLQHKSFKSQPVRLEPCFQIADYGAISHVLMSTDWRLIFNNCITVNDYWMALYTYLTQLVHRFVPFKQRSDKQGQIVRPVRKMLLAKRRAWCWWKLRPNPASKAEFNAASHRCREAVRQCLAEQEDRLLKAGSSKFFAHVSHQLHPSDHSVHLRAPTGTVSEPADVCEAFSKEFAKNFNSSSNSFCSPISTKENGTSASLSSANIDVVAVCFALAQLRDSAAGPDGLPALFYRRLAYVIAVSLSIVYQQSLSQGRIPDAWRQAKVIALYKGKGDKMDPSSYRPISLTAVACNVLELVVVDQMRHYLESSSPVM